MDHHRIIGFKPHWWATTTQHDFCTNLKQFTVVHHVVQERRGQVGESDAAQRRAVVCGRISIFLWTKRKHESSSETNTTTSLLLQEIYTGVESAHAIETQRGCFYVCRCVVVGCSSKHGERSACVIKEIITYKQLSRCRVVLNIHQTSSLVGERIRVVFWT